MLFRGKDEPVSLMLIARLMVVDAGPNNVEPEILNFWP